MQNTASKIRIVLVLAMIAAGVYAGLGAAHFAQSLQQHATQLPAEFR